jgi:hypothetical protein
VFAGTGNGGEPPGHTGVWLYVVAMTVPRYVRMGSVQPSSVTRAARPAALIWLPATPVTSAVVRLREHRAARPVGIARRLRVSGDRSGAKGHRVVSADDEVPPAPPPLDWTFVDELACNARPNMVTVLPVEMTVMSPPCPRRTGWRAPHRPD